MSDRKSVGFIEINPEHQFRYSSEWDPRRPGLTKGGYLEGKIHLPKDNGDLKVVISTVPETPLPLDEDIIRQHPGSQEVHPTIIFVVRKGRGKRMQEREPVPNPHHWKQEFHIVDKCVRIKNRTSDADNPRYDKISKIPDMDDVCMLRNDMVLSIGKKSSELNLVIIIPKTQERASEEELSIKKIVADRVPDSDATKKILDYYKKMTVLESRKVKIKIEIFSLESNILLATDFSATILDKGSKHHQPLDFCYVFPLRSCATGGRKVIMVSENPIPKDVLPKFQLYEKDGTKVEEVDPILVQPDETQISVMKETIIFITPVQPNMEKIMRNGWTIKLVAVRLSDGCESKKKYNFNFVPHDFYQPCIFCVMKPDGHDGKAILPSPIETSKTGKRKRNLPPLDCSAEYDNLNLQNETQMRKILQREEGISDPDDPKSYERELSRMPEFESQKHDVEYEVTPMVPMPRLIHLSQLQPRQHLHPNIFERGQSDPIKVTKTLIHKATLTGSNTFMLQPKDLKDIKIEPEEKMFKRTEYGSGLHFIENPYFLPPFKKKHPSVIVRPNKQPPITHQVKGCGPLNLKSYPVNLKPLHGITKSGRSLPIQRQYPGTFPFLSQNQYEVKMETLDDLDSLDDNLECL